MKGKLKNILKKFMATFMVMFTVITSLGTGWTLITVQAAELDGWDTFYSAIKSSTYYDFSDVGWVYDADYRMAYYGMYLFNDSGSGAAAMKKDSTWTSYHVYSDNNGYKPVVGDIVLYCEQDGSDAAAPTAHVAIVTGDYNETTHTYQTTDGDGNINSGGTRMIQTERAYGTLERVTTDWK